MELWFAGGGEGDALCLSEVVEARTVVDWIFEPCCVLNRYVRASISRIIQIYLVVGA